MISDTSKVVSSWSYWYRQMPLSSVSTVDLKYPKWSPGSDVQIIGRVRQVFLVHCFTLCRVDVPCSCLVPWSFEGKQFDHLVLHRATDQGDPNNSMVYFEASLSESMYGWSSPAVLFSTFSKSDVWKLRSTHSMQDDARGTSPSTGGWSHLPQRTWNVGRKMPETGGSPWAGVSRYPACPFSANNDGGGN